MADAAAIRDLSSIAGQVAIVTGGTAGIGLACAERFAAEGARVAVVARGADKGAAVAEQLTASGAEAIFVAGDCASEADMRAAAAAVLAKWGRIDILVNCAGGFIASPPFEELDNDTWHRVLDWNITSKFLLTREVVPTMKRNRYGRIVNISSLAGRMGIAFAPADYSASAAAIAGLTRRIAAELAPFGITANTVAAGTVRTPRAERLGEERISQIAAAIPMGRIGKPEEIAHVIWCLCTPGASFTTGAVLDANGGFWMG